MAVIGCSLADAVEGHVRPGDSVHVMLGHSRWTAAARELARQFWGEDPGFTLVMTSLGALGALFFEGGMVRRVVTAYSGNSFPTYNPNPIFCRGYQSGAVEVEHWSILTLAQRLEAAARGLPAVVTGSLAGSSMADNDGFATVASPFGQGPAEGIGLLAPLAPDVALLHAAVADAEGNLAVSEPLLEGVWGAWAARRGVVATVERVVDSLDGLGHRVRIPAHRVLAVVEAPFGAHPGGCYAGGLPVAGYGEDIPFWSAAAEAARGDFAAFARTYAPGPSGPPRLPRRPRGRPARRTQRPGRPRQLGAGRRRPPRAHGAAQPVGGGGRPGRPRGRRHGGAGGGRRRPGRGRGGQPGRLGGGGPVP